MIEFKFHCPFCHQPIKADEDWIGHTVPCPACHQEIDVKRDPDDKPVIPPIISVPEPVPVPVSAPKKAAGYEYKALSMKDPCFGGKFTPELLEKTLDGLAAQGWRVVTSLGVVSGTPARTENLLLLEREKIGD